MINVTESINELKHLLDTCVAEATLLSILNDKLADLRQAYQSDKSPFSTEHISFLCNLRENTMRWLVLFIELQDELPNVNSVEELVRLQEQFVFIKSKLQGLAVSKRVGKEIRELDEKLPGLREQEALTLQSKITWRIQELERHASLCSRGHAMRVEEKDGSHFWACSKFPMHEETRPMSPKDKAYLLD